MTSNPEVKKLNQSQTFVGIHLSGSNSQKTSLLIIEKTQQPFGVTSSKSDNSVVTIKKLYEKIGSLGSVYSDDRIAEILESQMPLTQVFLDSPLSLPPCVECVRDVCPGVLNCEDTSVAYMLSIASQKKSFKRKVRPVNPQSHRIWDIVHYEDNRKLGVEPSYSANKAPIVARARALEKRLRYVSQGLKLRETSLPHFLAKIANVIKLNSNIGYLYHSFEKGKETRESIVKQLMKRHAFILDDPDDLEKISRHIANFSAFIAALAAFYYQENLMEPIPESFQSINHWIYTPKI